MRRCAPRRGGPRRDRVSDRARKRAGPRLDAGEPRLGADPGRRRHARPLTAGCRVRDLALVVIDEQHRFGVEQRLGLYAKGREADTLLMSATPIPRTLMMTAYGDLDVSRLTEKPPGRHPVDTRTVALERIEDVVAAVGRALARKAKVYWICPMVEESETADLAAVEERHKTLAPLFPGRVGLVHGRMKPADKDRAMAGFAGGELDLLVATTVIEVGVDVPDATVMVIEHAERFGLAQLHQLRGRIGRGDKPSTCLLLYQSPLGDVAKRRLSILRETEDGFRIAEEDLRCAAPARCWAPGRAASRPCAWPILRSTKSWSRSRMTTPASCSNKTRTSKASAARPCALSSTCSAATKPCSTCGRVEAPVTMSQRLKSPRGLARATSRWRCASGAFSGPSQSASSGGCAGTEDRAASLWTTSEPRRSR